MTFTKVLEKVTFTKQEMETLTKAREIFNQLKSNISGGFFNYVWDGDGVNLTNLIIWLDEIKENNGLEYEEE